MAPHFEQPQASISSAAPPISSLAGRQDDEAMEDAAEAIRGVEVEAAQPELPDVSTLTPSQLESMNIDELRVVAKELDVPDRATITETDELMEAIRRYLPR